MPQFSGHLKLSFYALVLSLSACNRTQTPSGQVAYESAVRLLLNEHFQQAADQTERGLSLASPGSKLSWNFRLLRAQILLARRETKRAVKALATPPPDRPEFVEQMARYRLCQAHAALISRDTTTARTRLDQAQSLAAAANTHRLLAEIAFRRAALAIANRDSEQARELLLRIIDPAQHQDQDLRIAATNQMGYLLLHEDRYDEAVPWFKKAATHAKSSGLEASEARAVSNLGVCFLQLGDLDKALRNFRQAESTFASAGIPYERQISLGNIGNIEENNRDYKAAASDYRKALAMAKALEDDYWTGLWLDNLAIVFIELRDWDAAERYNNQALLSKRRIKEDSSSAYSAVNVGLIANGRSQYQTAQRAFEGVLRGSHEDPKLTLDAYAGLAEAFAGQHRDREALAQFQKAVAFLSRQQAALLDENDKLTWFSSVIRVYHEYVGFLLDHGKTLDALEVVQSSRGRVLSSRLGETGSHPLGTPRDLQRIAAQSGSTLLVYFIGPQKSYMWAVTAAAVQNYELPPEAELRRLVDAYDTFIQQLHDSQQEENPAGHALYEKLIAPAHLTTTKVILAPDGPLYSLNFATLPVPSPQGTHFWIEDVQVSIAPSFDLAQTTQRQQTPSLLLMGNPVSEDSEFPELTFAGQEINGIQQHLPGVRQVMYARSNARPAAYKQAGPEGFSWIHFVAHATANQDEPLQSAVILSRDAGSEYRLFARDVLKIPLHADLVTISACHGAGAKVYQGEGLVGFSWAFLKSGARHVIAGLWDVNDRSTAELMADLYGELNRGKSPDEALRTAQLAMLRSHTVFRKPFYWGPFEVFQTTAAE